MQMKKEAGKSLKITPIKIPVHIASKNLFAGERALVQRLDLRNKELLLKIHEKVTISVAKIELKFLPFISGYYQLKHQ